MGKFFDPINYQFYFCGYSETRYGERVQEIAVDFLRELWPYVAKLTEISKPMTLSISTNPGKHAWGPFCWRKTWTAPTANISAWCAHC